MSINVDNLTSWYDERMIAAILSMNPAICASFSPLALDMKASRVFGMIAALAPTCLRALTSSAVGGSLAGKRTSIGSSHPARQ